jgi:aerobic carbon-monoxide dehydrogenase medium subunit
MKPAPFEYWAPTSVDEALKLLSGFDDPGDAKIMAGGQSLMALLNLRLAQPAHIVDLNGVAELSSINRSNGTLTIGAMTRQRSAEQSAEVAAACPMLVQALRQVGHPQIRNRGTVGGSLAHADPAAELPALAVCLGAELVMRGPSGERTVNAREFFTGFLSTVLAEDEILTAVRIPVAGPATGSTFEEVARRHGDFAMVGVAAQVRLDGDTIAEANIALSGVAGQPVYAAAASAALSGQAPSPEVFAAAGAAAAADLDPTSDLHASAAYRKHVAGVLVRRALKVATVRARETK